MAKIQASQLGQTKPGKGNFARFLFTLQQRNYQMQTVTKTELRKMAEILVQAFLASDGKITKCKPAIAQGAYQRRIPHMGNLAVGIHRQC